MASIIGLLKAEQASFSQKARIRSSLMKQCRPGLEKPFRILPQLSSAPFPSTSPHPLSSSPEMKECLLPDSSSMTKLRLKGEGQRTLTINQTNTGLRSSAGGDKLGPPWRESRRFAGRGTDPALPQPSRGAQPRTRGVRPTAPTFRARPPGWELPFRSRKGQETDHRASFAQHSRPHENVTALYPASSVPMKALDQTVFFLYLRFPAPDTVLPTFFLQGLIFEASF